MTAPTESLSGKLQNNKPLPYNFNISSVLEETWDRVHGAKATYWCAIFVFLLAYLLLSCLFGGIAGLAIYIQQGFVDIQGQLFKNCISIASNAASFILSPLYAGIFFISALRASDQPIQYERMFAPFKKTLKIWGTLILTALIIFFAIIIFTFLLTLLFSAAKVMGLVWLMRPFEIGSMIILFLIVWYLCFAFMFAPLLVFEKNIGIYAAMKASIMGFSQHWFKILILQIALAVIVMISAIPLFIGMIWTLPMSLNLSGILYRIIFGVEQHPIK